MNELGTEMRRAPRIGEVHLGHFGFARVVEEDYKTVTARSHIYGYGTCRNPCMPTMLE